MRMFVALVPPAAVLDDLAVFLEPRQDSADPALRWSIREQWHVTLAFLPDVADADLDDLVERLGRAAAKRSPVGMAVAGAGAFPNPARARVLWAGLRCDDEQGVEELRRLATGCRAAAQKAGTVVEGGAFRPHLTLARLGRPTEVTRWLRVLDGYAGPHFEAQEIALIASYLGEGPRGRPRYETVATFALGRTPRRVG